MYKAACFLVFLLAAAAPLAACSSDDDDDDGSGGDGDTDGDGDGDTDGDADFDDCVTGVQQGGSEVFYGSSDEGGVIKYRWTSAAQDSALLIEIYSSYGAPSAPGTYSIDAIEANYQTCGLCILVFADDGSTVYMPVAGSGSMTLTDYSLSNPVGTTLSGGFTVEMQEVTINESTLVTTPVAGGCTGTLSATFDGTVVAFPEG